MILPEKSCLLRIFISENDHFKGKPLYEQIVKKARELNIAGSTVLRGVLGYGATSRIHSARLLTLSDDLPLVIEIVDKEERINTILPFLEENLKNGLVTMENIRVIKYGQQQKQGHK